MATITGWGAVSALGRGVARIWSAMAEGQDGIAPIRRFDASALGVELAALVPDRNAPEHAAASPVSCLDFALAAAREAWESAELDRITRDRIALVFGSSLGDTDVAIYRVADALGDALAIGGPRLAVTTACASSNNAIGLALDLLRLGAADAVLAGGADVLTPLVLAGFHALGVLAKGKCAPFSEPAGTTLGEGAGFLVLERGRAGRAAVLGYGLSADAHHDTGPDPSGAGIARGMRSALANAAISPAEVDYINAHGTGTLANDPAEWRAIQHVLGARADTVPVSSSKSFLGHGQGAAGVLEAIATLVAMEHDAIPPTQRYSVARPHSPRDAVGQATARHAKCEVAIANSSGFGGANCAIVIGRREPRAIARRPVAIAGVAAIGPHGTGAELDVRARGRVREFRLEDIEPAIDPSGFDPSTRYLLASLALARGDLKIRGESRDRSGLIVGVTAASPECDRALQATIDRHGYRGLSANLFSRQVVNAAPGTCARLLGLRGVHSVVSAGAATGLLAIIYAAELLATREEIERIFAAGLDELPPEESDKSEGAASVVLARSGDVQLAGWAIAGPGDLATARRDALAMAGVANADITLDSDAAAELVGPSDGFTSAYAVVHATRLLRAGKARHVLVEQRGGRSADCALVITKGPPA
jgi:3-oxoacyl-[acyl-carrier-protein] synthase II